MIKTYVQFYPTRAGMPDEFDPEAPLLGLVDGRLLVFPVQAPQCIARNRNGRRCRGLVIDLWTYPGDRWMTATIDGRRYDVDAYAARDEQAGRRALQQRCYTHDDADNPDYCDPEHYPFDPARDTGFLLPSITGSAGRDLAAIDAALAAAGKAFDRCVTSEANVDMTIEDVAAALAFELRTRLGGGA